MKNALIIFVRKPEAGKVKTRLAATVGDERALEIYVELLQHTFSVANETTADKFVFYTDEIQKNDLWNATGFFKRLQSANDLGHKMKSAFEEIFREAYNKVVIIGSDCLQLTSSIIAEGFAALDKTDVVIGPANDGGYYLLGMKELHASLFENKHWSSEFVFSDTVADFKKDGLSFTTLPVLTDVDTEEDWLATKQ